MKTNSLFSFIIVLILVFSCDQNKYVQVPQENPEYRENTAFKGSEDLLSPKFDQLKSKYRLDTIFNGEEDEFQRMLLLRNWIKSVIRIDDFGDPYPGGGYVEGILDAALQGTGFHCGHYMRVQNGVMNAYGYVTRTLGAGPGGEGGKDGHHGVNEIWSNSFQKWFLSDAKYNHHFEKDGIPLSALEIREEYLKNKAADIVIVKGPERIVTEIDPETQDSKLDFTRTYTWLEYDTHNDLFTKWPDHQLSLTFFEDDFSRDNVWIWDGKPHWAYTKPEFMILEPNPEAIEWTPNTIQSQLEIKGETAQITLTSQTPNLKEYQVKNLPSGQWERADSVLELPLEEDQHTWAFRSVNHAGVAGPAHRVQVQRE